jgi:toxin ParE1/3/4
MRHHGMEAAARYQALIAAAVRLLQETPSPPYSQLVRREPGVRALHLRHATGRLSSEDRVRNPRHLLLYQVAAADGVLEVLGLAHDGMQLSRAAGRARREADER